MAALPDINVLVALSYGAHVHHTAALAWLDAVQKDGYFAAFALAADAELVTFDTGFRSFAGLCHRILAP